MKKYLILLFLIALALPACAQLGGNTIIAYYPDTTYVDTSQGGGTGFDIVLPDWLRSGTGVHFTIAGTCPACTLTMSSDGGSGSGTSDTLVVFLDRAGSDSIVNINKPVKIYPNSDSGLAITDLGDGNSVLIRIPQNSLYGVMFRNSEILPAKLDASNVPTDSVILCYDDATSQFQWIPFADFKAKLDSTNVKDGSVAFKSLSAGTQDSISRSHVGVDTAADGTIDATVKYFKFKGSATWRKSVNGDTLEGTFTGTGSGSVDTVWVYNARTGGSRISSIANAITIRPPTDGSVTVTLSGDTAIFAASLGADIVSGEIVNQTIVKADLDTTTVFTVAGLFKINGNVADSAVVTKGYTDKSVGAKADTSSLMTAAALSDSLAKRALTSDFDNSTIDTTSAGKFRIKAAGVSPTSHIAWPTEYLQMVNVYGFNRALSDSIYLNDFVTSNNGDTTMLVVDSAGNITAGDRDTFSVCIDLPYNFKIDSLAFLYMNTGDSGVVDIDFRGPDLSSGATDPGGDSSYWTSTTNRTSATWAAAGYLFSESVGGLAGQRYCLKIITDFRADNNRLRIAWIKLIGTRQ